MFPLLSVEEAMKLSGALAEFIHWNKSDAAVAAAEALEKRVEDLEVIVGVLVKQVESLEDGETIAPLTERVEALEKKVSPVHGGGVITERVFRDDPGKGVGPAPLATERGTAAKIVLGDNPARPAEPRLMRLHRVVREFWRECPEPTTNEERQQYENAHNKRFSFEHIKVIELTPEIEAALTDVGRFRAALVTIANATYPDDASAQQVAMAALRGEGEEE